MDECLCNSRQIQVKWLQFKMHLEENENYVLLNNLITLFDLICVLQIKKIAVN